VVIFATPRRNELNSYEISFNDCKKIGKKSHYDVDEFGKFETLCGRYSRGIDFLIRKLFRTIDEYEFENQGTLIDVVNNAHKRGLFEKFFSFPLAKAQRAQRKNAVAVPFLRNLSAGLILFKRGKTMGTTRKLVSFDWAMKRLLRSKANFDILEGFLTELLGRKITIVEILESETNKERSRDKFSRLDLKCKNHQGEIVIIEVQYQRELDFLQRILFGVAKTITEHFDEGWEYSEVVKVISIAIVYFDLGRGSDYIYHGTTTFKGLHNNEKLSLNSLQREYLQKDHPSELFPEMYVIKVKNFDDVAKNTLDEWIYFLKNGKIKENFKAKGLKKAQKKLDVLKMSDKERKEYEAYFADLSYQASMFSSSYGAGKFEGRKEGLEQGIEQGKALTIIEMLQDGDISFAKAKQKIDKLKSQRPDAHFWADIYELLNNQNPGMVKEPKAKYRTRRKTPKKKQK
jgi:predicted transposase/invertase (TIGR01784 family)